MLMSPTRSTFSPSHPLSHRMICVALWNFTHKSYRFSYLFRERSLKLLEFSIFVSSAHFLLRPKLLICCAQRLLSLSQRYEGDELNITLSIFSPISKERYDERRRSRNEKRHENENMREHSEFYNFRLRLFFMKPHVCMEGICVCSSS